MEENIQKSKSRTKVAIGLLVVVFGSLWLAKNLGLVCEHFVYAIFNWKVLLISIGIIFLFSKHKNKFGSIILIIIGSVFLVKDHIMPDLEAFRVIFPIMIIMLGLFIIFKRVNNNHKFHHHYCTGRNSDVDMIEEVNVFSGRKSYYDSQNFKGGSTVSIFGGTELDLSGAKLADGVVVLESVSIFGGSVYVVPKGWNVKVEVVGIMGGFTDKRKKLSYESPDTNGTLIIKGVAIFGGGELKNSKME